MSSVCGFLQRDGAPVGPERLRCMVDALAHWDHDGKAMWQSGEAGLGHVALWTTAEAVGEVCPFIDPLTGNVVTADARLDNREELLAELAPGSGRVIGDVELIALAYCQWAEDCAARLIGDFALAIWDARKRRFFCARDPMGVRPFFYYVDARRFVFGSEIKAVFTLREVPRDLNRLKLAVTLAGLPTFDGQTSFRAVKQLEPASALTVDASGWRCWKYWQLDLEREITLPRDEDYVDAFEDILRQAIRTRVRSTGRVGSLLSGGLDATTCLELARQAVPTGGITAFSWALAAGDDWWVPDERRYIEAYLRAHPVDHAYILNEPRHLLDFPPEMRRHRDGPESRVDHCQFLPTFAEAKRRGVRVLLHGAGGDEASSYAALDFPAACLFAGDFEALRHELEACAARSGRSRWRALPQLMPLWRQPRRWSSLFNYQWLYRRRLERVQDLTELGIPLAANVAREVGLVEYVREASRPRIPGAWRRPMRADQIYTLTQTHVMSDQIAVWDYAASFGVECRCPYLDRRVIEFAVAMPPRQHRFRGVNRRLLRRVAQRLIPNEIAQRRDKSPTMPDLARSVCAVAPELSRRIAQWRATPRVAEMIDVARLEADLALVIKTTQERSVGWTPLLPFCRGAFLADFLVQNEGF